MEKPIHRLTEQQAIDRIIETMENADPGDAPFALVLGSGFSHGLVPTAKQLVEESLPLWLRSRKTGESFDELTNLPSAEKRKESAAFWKRFVEKNPGCTLTLDPSTGIPADISAAYMAAFEPNKYTGAVGEPRIARMFQRALMKLDEPRLNDAHFFLASIIGVQPGRNRPSDSFQTRAAFSRLILTTNFDPFLQTALQSVNRLYCLSLGGSKPSPLGEGFST